MEMVIDLFAREAMIAGIPSSSPFVEAVQSLCKLYSHPLLSNPFISQKKVTIHHFIFFDGPLKQFNGLRMS
jgi:hypothetical protein